MDVNIGHGGRPYEGDNRGFAERPHKSLWTSKTVLMDFQCSDERRFKRRVEIEAYRLDIVFILIPFSPSRLYVRDKVDSTELERGVTSLWMAKDLLRLNILVAFLKVHERVDFLLRRSD